MEFEASVRQPILCLYVCDMHICHQSSLGPACAANVNVFEYSCACQTSSILLFTYLGRVGRRGSQRRVRAAGALKCGAAAIGLATAMLLRLQGQKAKQA